MIIRKGEINQVVITVTEQTTISSPYYLFEFISKATKIPTYCIAQATTTARCDTFQITEKSNPVAASGEVSLAEGDYTYKVYQQSSSTNTDPNNTTLAASGFAYVEIGLCRVPSSGNEVTEYSGSDTTYKEYNG